MVIELWQVALLGSLAVLAAIGLILLLAQQPLREIKQRLERDAELSLAAFLIFIPARLFWLILSVLVLPVVIFMSLMVANGVWSVLACLLCFAGLPWLRTTLLKRRRQKIEKQLPNALQLLASSLQAGLSLTPAIELVAKQLPRPLQMEFRLLVQRQRTGDSLMLALEDFYRRSPSTMVRFFTFAIDTGHRYGGQQAQMLSRMACAIQQQQYARERMLSLSAQARLQGKVMFVLPFGLFFAIGEVQEQSKALLLTTQEGRVLLLLCGCLMLIGIALTRRIMGRFNDDA
ncbi:type II secretion system F family protein [Pseudidiomarina sp. 1APR75-15]|uniref:Type II secretion system F family protein n=1 Tax=Pseudidiomarina terrestris TaxID=2820060 RepID=A0ABT8ML21_9GAMM|nr:MULTISPECIES: type II secretion system F family protein [unclassified Pseudidiomarina]MDN7130651.1 type II secretion system F family protein [Pseudidiomarina sp. 1APR75-15]MEA3589149.1 type II secretion system F family protein [Pseudidiomarina sp. 1APP75-27a]